MKKLSFLLALLLALGAVSALAEPAQAQKVYEIKRGQFLGTTAYVAFQDESFGLQGIIAPDGTKVVPNEYLNLESRNPWSYVTAVKHDQLNGRGVIGLDGKVLIPFEYGDIIYLSEEWAYGVVLKESTEAEHDYKAIMGGYGSGYYLVEGTTFYNMKTGQAVGTLPREAVDSVYPYPGFLIIKDREGALTVYDEALQPIGTASALSTPYEFVQNGDQWDVKRAGDGKLLFTTPHRVTGYDREDGTFRFDVKDQVGRMDMEGNVLIPAEYARIQTAMGGYFPAKKEHDGKTGLLDREGKVVVDFKYDEFPVQFLRGVSIGSNGYLFAGGYAPVKLDGKLGFVNQQGEETLAPTYAEAAVKVKGSSLMYVDPAGNTTIVAADGTVTSAPYQDVEVVYNAADGRVFQGKDASGMVGAFDWHGNVLLPFGNYSNYGMYTSVDGSLLLTENKDSRMLEVYKLPQ